jgi:hypothetical protein
MVAPQADWRRSALVAAAAAARWGLLGDDAEAQAVRSARRRVGSCQGGHEKKGSVVAPPADWRRSALVAAAAAARWGLLGEDAEAQAVRSARRRVGSCQGGHE